ncbi:MAG: hypothetical protein H5U01_00265, partial [Clostridia bacterium]|nr:hypothetical protein [Clostridia bacterium]
MVEQLLIESSPPPGRVFSSADLEGLPAPVQRYLRRAIPEGQPYVTAVRLHQRGAFRLGDRTSPWKPFTVQQVFTTYPPGFAWDATIEMASLLPVRVVDMYKSGKGAFWAKVLSTLIVANARDTSELDQGELMRYLGEAVWFPTALLSGHGVSWHPSEETRD